MMWTLKPERLQFWIRVVSKWILSFFEIKNEETDDESGDLASDDAEE